MYKFYKILFLSILVISTIISISSYSWMMMWLGVETNLMSMIPLMMSKNFYSKESMLKYFMIQSLASTLMMFSLLLMEKNMTLINNYENSIIMILQSSMLMKLGMAPFHYWLPEVTEGLSWTNCFIMLTWQKMAPMIMIMMTLKNSSMIIISILLSSLISGIYGLNQVSMRKILTYSSINHMSWMLMSLMSSSWTWLIYFFIYSINNMNLIWYFSSSKIFFINQINSMSNDKISKTMVMMNFLSLSGIPPMIGFLPKWLTINWMIMQMNLMLTFILIMTTMIHVYFYIRIMIPSMTLKIKEMKMKIYSPMKMNFFLLNNMFLLSLPIYSIYF